MAKKISEPAPMRGLKRLLARAPIALYRAGLGWLLTRHFLMLTHIGRVSGKRRFVVLEVVKHDKGSGAYYVASGWGEKSDWLRNVLKNPDVTVTVGRGRFAAKAERLPPEEAAEVLADYGRRYPRMLEELARVMGYRIERSEDDYRELGRLVPIVRLTPNADAEGR